MRIHLVVNISRIVRYRESMKRQKIEEAKLIEVNKVEEWKVDKKLNSIKIRGIIKYLIQ